MACCPAGRLINHVQKVHLYGEVSHSAVSHNVLVCSGAKVRDSIIMEGAMIGPGAQVQNSIIDRGAVVSPFAEIGFDREYDAVRHMVSPGGVVVVSPRDENPSDGSYEKSPALSEDLFLCCPERFPKRCADEEHSGSFVSFC
jgi:glucose-1-phosphate adenylyltransferase